MIQTLIHISPVSVCREGKVVSLKSLKLTTYIYALTVSPRRRALFGVNLSKIQITR